MKGVMHGVRMEGCSEMHSQAAALAAANPKQNVCLQNHISGAHRCARMQRKGNAEPPLQTPQHLFLP